MEIQKPKKGILKCGGKSMNKSVTIYTSALCPVCGMVKNLLDSLEISYKEVSVDMNPIARIKLIGKTKKLSVPQTNINGKWISGFNPEKIDRKSTRLNSSHVAISY